MTEQELKSWRDDLRAGDTVWYMNGEHAESQRICCFNSVCDVEGVVNFRHGVNNPAPSLHARPIPRASFAVCWVLLACVYPDRASALESHAAAQSGGGR